MEKLLTILNTASVDGIYLTNLYNLRYFTGFTGTTGTALFTKEKALFFADFRYVEQAKNQVEKYGFEVVEISKNSLDTIAEYINKMGLKKIGIENKHITLENYHKVKDAFKVELVSLDGKLDLTRMIKTEDEIANIKKAIDISDIAFSEVIKIIKEGVSEKELAAYLEYTQKKLGATKESFNTIVASGYRSAMPHGVASDKKIEREEFITFDFGCYYNGYVSDMTRTVYYGSNISPEKKELYDIVLSAQLLGIDEVRAGISGFEIDKIVRDYIISKGYKREFGHGLGHGIGLEIHEEPTLSTLSNTKLEKNMVVTIEPGIYIKDFAGVRIEDDVIITEDGCEVLNKTTKELIMIG